MKIVARFTYFFLATFFLAAFFFATFFLAAFLAAFFFATIDSSSVLLTLSPKRFQSLMP